MLSLKLMWSMELALVHPQLNSQSKPCVAFTLDFNEVYLLYHKLLCRLEYRPKNVEENSPPRPTTTLYTLTFQTTTNITSAVPLLL